MRKFIEGAVTALQDLSMRYDSLTVVIVLVSLRLCYLSFKLAISLMKTGRQ